MDNEKSGVLTPLQKLEEEYANKRNEIISQITKDFEGKFNALKIAFEALPEEIRKGVFSTVDSKATLAALGLNPGKTPNKGKSGGTSPRKTRSELKEEDVLKYAGKGEKTGKSKGEFIKNFSGGAQKVGDFIDGLHNAKKLKSGQRKGKQGKPATVYFT